MRKLNTQKDEATESTSSARPGYAGLRDSSVLGDAIVIIVHLARARVEDHLQQKAGESKRNQSPFGEKKMNFQKLLSSFKKPLKVEKWFLNRARLTI